MSRRPDGFKVGEEWHGHQIMVDEKGVFYVAAGGRRTHESKTLSGLKAKIAQQTPVRIAACMERGYGYGDEDRMTSIVVYAFTALGGILYTADGQKQKAREHEKIYVFDEAKLEERRKLLAQKRLTEQKLQLLMKHWPRVTAPMPGTESEGFHPEPESEQ